MHTNRPTTSFGDIPALSPSTYVAYTGILLLLAILLASCGGSSGGGSSSGGGGGGSSNPAPISLSSASEQGAIVLSWTNPSAEELAKLITENGGNTSIRLRGFRISYFSARMPVPIEINITTLNTAADANVTWKIPQRLQSQNSTDFWTFRVYFLLDNDETIAGDSITTLVGTDTDGDGIVDIVDTDDDNDGVLDGADNCPLASNRDQLNTDNATGASDGFGDVCDDDDDNDNVTDISDVDADGDGLIEITTLEQLHSLRDDLDGNGTDDGNLANVTALGGRGCPTEGCTGYELMSDLDFTDNASYTSGTVNTTWTTGAGWPGIGSCTDPTNCESFSGNFNGNGFTIANLFINASSTTNGVGLFAAANGTMSNLRVINASVSGGSSDMGVLIGYGRNADIRNVGSNGVVESSGNDVGGLIGDGDLATVENSYATGSVSVRSNTGLYAGGLIGSGEGASVTNSYATANVIGNSVVGGLIGYGDLATVENSYATGSVSGSSVVGGLVRAQSVLPTIRFSYWDTETTGQATSGGRGTGQTTSELQTPTDFTGIYLNWGNALCADGTRAWDLGTSSQYPALTCTPGGVAAQR